MTDIGFLLYPRLTQLDLTGPYEVLSRGPDARCHLIWKTLEPVPADSGLTILPTTTMADCPQLDVLCVPGGSRGMWDIHDDEETLEFLRQQGERARFVTSVCTGSLLLGNAGLLKGYRATTHWSAVEKLAHYGTTYQEGRVVRDRNRITGGGVTAGIDFGLTLAAELWGEAFAQAIQLGLEYAPAPPYNAGTPASAPPEVVAMVTALLAQRRPS